MHFLLLRLDLLRVIFNIEEPSAKRRGEDHDGTFCDGARSLLPKANQYIKWIQARIAQLVAYRLGTGEVPGSNPGKSENFSVKISNWIVQI